MRIGFAITPNGIESICVLGKTAEERSKAMIFWDLIQDEVNEFEKNVLLKLSLAENKNNKEEH